ncbi:MAG TPA: hypothetical protein VGP68_07975 [Gemmataceae bacterium]|jgi:hypothetical protein|nr:hypothetical protein [Gemmataceae bacterium]
MRSSKVIPEDAKEQFWSVVKDCLREFHQSYLVSTLKKITQFRAKLDGLPDEEMELFYHSEPFDVACNLAKHQLKIEDYLARYLEIRDEEVPRQARPRANK